MQRNDEAPDPVRLYLESIGREPLLTKDDEQLLAHSIEAGRQAGEELGRISTAAAPAERRRALEEMVSAGERARQRFVRANLRLVVSVARRWAGSPLPLLDLIQEGNVGLISAVEHFDYRRGFRFSTYATWWIRQAIARAVANTGRLVRLPVHTGDALARVLRERRRLEEQNGAPPGIEAVAAACGLPSQAVAGLLRLAPEPVSISEPIGTNGDEFGSMIADMTAPSPAELAFAGVVAAEVERLLSALDTRDREVLSLRFGLSGSEPRSLEDVGRALGLSKEGVRQTQARALKALRRAAALTPGTRELLGA